MIFNWKHEFDGIFVGFDQLVSHFKDRKIFVTGGTGFFGKWMLQTFCYLNDYQNSNIAVYVLSRDPDLFLRANPDFNRNDIVFVKGDVQKFSFLNIQFDYLIHAATDADAQKQKDFPLLFSDTIIGGTENIMRFASHSNISKVLYVSSGAVYDNECNEDGLKSEEIVIDPSSFSSGNTYGLSKKQAEIRGGVLAKEYNIQFKIARCFSFVGPYLPLNGLFAIGNFIEAILKNKDIVVRGDGTALRSYMYAADLMTWLFTILINGKDNYPYNVGSNQKISIKELAYKCAEFSQQKLNVIIEKKETLSAAPNTYLPSTARAEKELGLKTYTSIDESLARTIDYYRKKTG